MMPQGSIRGLAICAIALLVTLNGCESRNSEWKETFPVSGVVYADGKPADGVNVTLNPVGGMDQKQPTVSSAMTDKEGKFVISTYEVGDGAPEGEYKVTFTWGKLNPISMAFEGDKFKGRYRDPKKSEVTVTVAAGQDNDMGQIDLKTKK